VSVEAADGLVLEGRDLLQWARRSVGVGGLAPLRPHDGFAGRPGSPSLSAAGERDERPRRPSLRVVEGLLEGKTLGGAPGGMNSSGFGGLRRIGTGRMQDFASDEGSDDGDGDMAQATTMMDGINGLLGGTKAARGADPASTQRQLHKRAPQDGQGQDRYGRGSFDQGENGGYEDHDEDEDGPFDEDGEHGPLPGPNVFLRVTRDAFTHPSMAGVHPSDRADTLESQFGATGTLTAGAVRDPAMGRATWGHA